MTVKLKKKHYYYYYFESINTSFIEIGSVLEPLLMEHTNGNIHVCFFKLFIYKNMRYPHRVLDQ